MEKKRDISKRFALALIILTVLISATSTWVLVTHSMSAEPGPAVNKPLIHLFITRGEPLEPAQTDTNSGNVRLLIGKPKGG